MKRLSGKHILLGITGGIAAYKSAELTRRLRDAGAQVRVVMTRAATEFGTLVRCDAAGYAEEDVFAAEPFHKACMVSEISELALVGAIDRH